MKKTIFLACIAMSFISLSYGQTHEELEERIYQYFEFNEKQIAISNEISRNKQYIPSSYLRILHSDFPKHAYKGNFEEDLAQFKIYLSAWIEENPEKAHTFYTNLTKD